jgi:transcriptional regulator with GAF, ATPase, and Fis domain
MAVPPGSAVSTTTRPRSRRYSARRRICVLLPDPSSPSKVINKLRSAIGILILREARSASLRRYNVGVAKAKDLEWRFQRIEQQLRLFQKISRFMVREMSLQEVLGGVVSLVVEFTQGDSCLIYLLDNDELVLCASNTPHPSTIGKVRLRLNEGLTGWVARERRLLAISREAYKDPRFKSFGELPEDGFEAFLSAPIIARNRVVGVINVQHRLPHQHTGGEMEVLTTVGEQIGCVLVLARMEPTAVESANHVELVLSAGPIRMKQ